MATDLTAPASRGRRYVFGTDDVGGNELRDELRLLAEEGATVTTTEQALADVNREIAVELERGTVGQPSGDLRYLLQRRERLQMLADVRAAMRRAG